MFPDFPVAEMFDVAMAIQPPSLLFEAIRKIRWLMCAPLLNPDIVRLYIILLPGRLLTNNNYEADRANL
jgi:hypothetical protein